MLYPAELRALNREENDTPPSRLFIPVGVNYNFSIGLITPCLIFTHHVIETKQMFHDATYRVGDGYRGILF